MTRATKESNQSRLGEILTLPALRQYSREVRDDKFKTPSACAREQLKQLKHATADDSFYGGENAHKAADALTFGRRDLVNSMRVNDSTLLQELIQGAAPQLALGVVGSSPSVPRFLASHPIAMRRYKTEERGMQRVVIELSSIWHIDSASRLNYALGGLAIARALALRGPTELYLATSTAAYYPDCGPESYMSDNHITILTPVGMAPWDLSLLAGMSTSGVVRGLHYARIMHLHRLVNGVEVNAGLPRKRIQQDDLLSAVFPDWDSNRSVLIPGMEVDKYGPKEAFRQAVEDAVWGSAL